jgi:hypothetical protein
MGFGLNYDTAASGDIIPIVKYDSRAGRIFRIDRENGQNSQIDISRGFKAIVDLENVEKGFIDFPPGSAPSFTLVPLADPMPQHPGGTAKQGVRLMMKLHRDSGGDVREMATSAKAAMRGLDLLHTEYSAQAAANPGKLPVVEMTNTIPITSEGQGQKTTNYQPVFAIVGWVPRPADLVFKPKGRSSSVAPSAPRNNPPATGSSPVSAPAPQARQLEPAGADDGFG